MAMGNVNIYRKPWLLRTYDGQPVNAAVADDKGRTRRRGDRPDGYWRRRCLIGSRDNTTLREVISLAARVLDLPLNAPKAWNDPPPSRVV